MPSESFLYREPLELQISYSVYRCGFYPTPTKSREYLVLLLSTSHTWITNKSIFLPTPPWSQRLHLDFTCLRLEPRKCRRQPPKHTATCTMEWLFFGRLEDHSSTSKRILNSESNIELFKWISHRFSESHDFQDAKLCMHSIFMAWAANWIVGRYKSSFRSWTWTWSRMRQSSKSWRYCRQTQEC